MYVRVMPSGQISFRLDYRLNGRRETVYVGKYGRDGISRARELCLDARRAIREGRSPAIEKRRLHPSLLNMRRVELGLGYCTHPDDSLPWQEGQAASYRLRQRHQNFCGHKAQGDG